MSEAKSFEGADSVLTVPSAQVLNRLQGGLIVSCQPVPGGALDSDEMVVALAQASQDGGAVAVRIEGSRRVQLVAARVAIPVIGIVKRDLDTSPVRITPWVSDVYDLAQAGAAVIAVDATHRQRPESIEDLLAAIHAKSCLAMADCSNLPEGLAAHRMGFDCVGSTLSGYTHETHCAEDALPDDRLVRDLSAAGVWTIAEGRYQTPELAARAIQWGAKAVTVGSALTRLEWMVKRYAQTMSAGHEALSP
jgi:N-acylglucosamine-6-phosphate 2-epimerase